MKQLGAFFERNSLLVYPLFIALLIGSGWVLPQAVFVWVMGIASCLYFGGLGAYHAWHEPKGERLRPQNGDRLMQNFAALGIFVTFVAIMFLWSWLADYLVAQHLPLH